MMDLELEKALKERDEWRNKFAEREFVTAIEAAARAAGVLPAAVEDVALRARRVGWQYDVETSTVKPAKDSTLPPRMALTDWARQLRAEAPYFFPVEGARAPATYTKEQARNPSPELLRAIAEGRVVVVQ